MPGPDDCFPRLDVWAYPEPVKTDAALYGPNGAAVAALLTAALDLDGDALWNIASAADFDYADRAQRRADEQRIRDRITVAAQATNRVEQVRLAFAAGERAAFYAASPGLGSLDFWGNQAEASATAPVGNAAAGLVVADALAPGDLDLVLRAWRARDKNQDHENPDLPVGPSAMRIPPIGLIVRPAPPNDYPRYRSLLGTNQEQQCALCDRHAQRMWFDGVPPAVPVCESCFVESGAEHGDPACGTLARLDETGVWRPTGQGGDIQAEPYDFDW